MKTVFALGLLALPCFGADVCAGPKLENHFFNGDANGKLVRRYENEDKRFISMTVKAAVNVCERADKSLYFVVEEYMNKSGTILVYYPVSPIQTAIVDPSYFGGGAGQTDHLINLGRTDHPISPNELFLLQEKGDTMTVTYFRKSWNQLEQKLKAKAL